MCGFYSKDTHICRIDIPTRTVLVNKGVQEGGDGNDYDRVLKNECLGRDDASPCQSEEMNGTVQPSYVETKCCLRSHNNMIPTAQTAFFSQVLQGASAAKNKKSQCW